ncbi:MAG: hypothetical protein HYW38_00480 [Candidatus Colwellbacteria bacterium]|nr:hypothetical protein [Candidatus Colwellbacteria bacterium]
MYYRDTEHFKGTAGYVVDGVWYPRVTSIINIKSKPALYRFYAELNGFSEGESIKKKSADEGTKVHEAVQAILTGKEPEIDPTILPAVAGFRKFLDETNIQVDPDFIEKRIVSFNERYAGTIDALALINGRFGILDIKTSQAIYRDYNLQTAAYFPPLQEQFRNLQTRWILRIDQTQDCLNCGATRRLKGGREKIRVNRNNGAMKPCSNESHQWSELQGQIELKEFPYWQDDYAAFLGAKKLWEWEHDYWLKQIGYL